jgi:hypothetical protein
MIFCVDKSAIGADLTIANPVGEARELSSPRRGGLHHTKRGAWNAPQEIFVVSGKTVTR